VENRCQQLRSEIHLVKVELLTSVWNLGAANHSTIACLSCCCSTHTSEQYTLCFARTAELFLEAIWDCKLKFGFEIEQYGSERDAPQISGHHILLTAKALTCNGCSRKRMPSVPLGESLERRFESVFGCHLDSQESSQRNRNFAYTTFTGVFCCFQKHKRNQCCYFVALVCVGFVFGNILALGFSRI
jgi:hypothetical protein